MSKRRAFTPEFKAKVVLEVLSGTRSSSEACLLVRQACREYGLRASLLSRWKAVFVERSALVFESGEHRSQEQARIAELERLVGRQTLEIEILKKVSTILPAHESKRGSWL